MPRKADEDDEPDYVDSDTPSSNNNTSSNNLRRSARIRDRPKISSSQPSSPLPTNGNLEYDSLPEDRLNQISYRSSVTLETSSIPTCFRDLKVQIHPVAAAVLSIHSHMARTEVIGYLAGAVYDRTLLIAEAVPAEAVGERVLARTGRSALSEVEMDPGSAAEVCDRVSARGLQVVGWYHTHPASNFSAEPSLVDLENQLNYQRYMFSDAPFVAIIVAPYSDGLPDHRPDVEVFWVATEKDKDSEEEDLVPIRIPTHIKELPQVEVLSQYEIALANRSLMEAFSTECVTLISTYAGFGKRVKLCDMWKDDITGIQKLRNVLNDVVSNRDFRAYPHIEGSGVNGQGNEDIINVHNKPNGIANTNNQDNNGLPVINHIPNGNESHNGIRPALRDRNIQQEFADTISQILEGIDTAWRESDEQAAERRRQRGRKRKRPR